MSKHHQQQKQPEPPKPATPQVDGKFYRLFRGKGDYAPFVGLESVTVEGGKVVSVTEEKFPTLFGIVGDVALDSMQKDMRE